MNAHETLRRATATTPGAAEALPFSAYRDPEVFELEMERAFRGDWVAVCSEAALAEPGDYVALAIGGEPVAVLRGKDGTLRALSNVCRHRGTPLLDDGMGNATSIVCPYHAWAYADDGSFRGAPYTGNVEICPSAHALPRFALEVWSGVVFVNVDGRAAPLAERLAGVTEQIERFGLARYDVPFGGFTPKTWQANWKLVYENAIESYHLFKVHKDTLERFGPTRGAFYLAGNALASVTAGRVERPGTGRSDEPDTLGDFERDHYLLVAVPPSFVAILTRDSWGWIAIHPERPDRTHLVAGALVPRALAVGAGRDRDQLDALSQAFLDEDQVICERGQRGMQSRHSRGGRLVELERILGDFHQYLGARLFGQTPDATHREPPPVAPADAGRHGASPPPSVDARSWRPVAAFVIALAVIGLIEIGLWRTGGSAEASPPAAASVPASFDAEALRAQYVTAWHSEDGRFDVDALAALYAPEADRVFYDAFETTPSDWSFPRGWPIGRQPLVQGLTAFALEPAGRYETLALAPDRVLVTGSYRLRATMTNVAPFTGTLRQTALWERRDDRWVMTHEHLSVPVEELE